MLFTREEMFAAAAAYVKDLEDSSRAINVVDAVKLPDIFAPVIANAERAARTAHEKWYQDAKQRGVTRDENPNFVSYDELSDEIKDANMSAALRTYRIFVYLGVKFTKTPTEVNQEKMDKIITLTTEVIHDGWSKDKIAAGWSFAPERDNMNKKHTDLLDLSILLAIWPGKDEWDRNAARGSMESLAADYGIYPVIN